MLEIRRDHIISDTLLQVNKKKKRTGKKDENTSKIIIAGRKVDPRSQKATSSSILG